MSNLKSPNEPPYVISYRLLLHVDAIRVIFGQIQGDYINFTMAAMAAMLNLSAGSKINHHIDFLQSRNTCVGCLVDIKLEIGEIRTFLLSDLDVEVKGQI